MGAAASLPLLVWSFFSMGGGHGSYLPAILCFPYAMLLSIGAQSITVPLLLFALAQFPIYGGVLGWSDARPWAKWMWVLLITLHVAAATATLVLARRDSSFWP